MRVASSVESTAWIWLTRWPTTSRGISSRVLPTTVDHRIQGLTLTSASTPSDSTTTI